MTTLRAAVVATVLAVGVAYLPASQAFAVSASGPSRPPGTPVFDDSRVLVANDAGVLVGELGSQVLLWRGGRATTLTDRGGQVHAINAAGSFVGTTPFPLPNGETDFRATVWTSAGVPTDIAPTNATFSVGQAITDDGTVALSYATRTGKSRLALWRGGTRTPLALGENALFSAMNQRGQVAATAYRDGVWTATLCSATGSCAALPRLPGTIRSEAYDINDSGVVVGSADIRTSATTVDTVAVVWRNGRATALPGLSAPAGQGYSRAEHVNNTGLVAGRSGGATKEAVLWKDGAVVRLSPGTPVQTFELGVTGINDAGEVVGVLRDDSNASQPTYRGFLWRAGTRSSITPSFPLRSVEVFGITPAGLIYGSSFTSTNVVGGSLYTERATTWRAIR